MDRLPPKKEAAKSYVNVYECQKQYKDLQECLKKYPNKFEVCESKVQEIGKCVVGKYKGAAPHLQNINKSQH